jgi:RNA polymerase sigma factor for flagellar operon FliA
MPMVETIARQLQRTLKWSNFEDLQSAGHEGLLQAARNFDPSVGVSFRHFMSIRVRGAMIDAVRSQAGVPRRVLERFRAIEAADDVTEALAEEQKAPPATAEEADTRLTDYLANIATAMALGLLPQPVVGLDGADEPEMQALDAARSVDDQIAREQLLAKVRAIIDKQPEAERHILKRYYFDGVELSVAAKELGLSKSWVTRIHARAIEKVTQALRASRVIDPHR